MKTKKQTLDTKLSLQIKLLGICSQEFDYKICYLINKTLNLDLRRIEDIEIFYQKHNIKGSYANFFYEDEESFLDYMLIVNHHPAGDLIPEASKYDYLIRLSGEVDHVDMEDLIKSLRSIDQVIFVTEIQVNTLKSKNNLIF